MKYKWYDKIIFAIRKQLHSKYIFTVLLGYLFAQLVNLNLADIVNNSILGTIENLIRYLFEPVKLLNVINIIISGFVIVAFLLRKLLDWYVNKTNVHVKFSKYTEKNVDDSIRPYTKQGFSWDNCVSLILYPEIEVASGWVSKDIDIDYRDRLFSFESKQQVLYDEYISVKYEEGSKLMVNNLKKFIGTDQKAIEIPLQNCLFNQIRFFQQLIHDDPKVRIEMLDSFFESYIVKFPHALCCHLVVVTEDEEVLLTKRSNKLHYHPSTWSVSIEEQLQLEDVKMKNPIQYAIKRGLFEELGVTEENISDDDIHVMSFFLEGDVLNIALSAVVQLKCKSNELDAIIKSKIRNDYEFTDWKFVASSELLEIVEQDDMMKHPTSEYRSILYSITRYGYFNVQKKLLY